MKTTTVTLEYWNAYQGGERIALRFANDRDCPVFVFMSVAKDLFGTRIVNKVRKANGQAVKVKCSFEVVE